MSIQNKQLITYKNDKFTRDDGECKSFGMWQSNNIHTQLRPRLSH